MGYADLSTAFEYKSVLLQSQLDQLAENDKFLKDNGWEDGTKALFFQAAAPVGWTQDTSQNDKMLRVVSGIGGGNGGSHLLSTTISLQHTSHVITSDPNHTHDMGSHSHNFNGISGVGAGIAGKVGLDGSDRLRVFVHTGDSNTIESVFNRMDQQGTLTAPNAGGHDHGGFTINSRLSDVAIAYVDVIVCVKDASAGYTDLTNAFNHNDKIVFELMDQLADNDEFLRLRITPFGTKSYFSQAAVPTGWTQDTSQDGKALRVVSGAGGGSGGAFDFADTISLAHDHSALSNQAAHVHAIPNHAHRSTAHTEYFSAQVFTGYLLDLGSGTGIGLSTGASLANRDVIKGQTATDSGADSSSDGSHDHATGSSLSDITLFHFDMIAGTKDSGGSSSAYTDMTAEFLDEKLVSKQRLNKLGANDEYLKFHSIEATTFMNFFQPTAPLNWTQSVAQNDRGLRVVDGAGAGIGGAAGISAEMTLQHLHSLDSKGHDHTFLHTHPLPVDNINVGVASAFTVLTGDSSFSELTMSNITGSTNELRGGTLSNGNPSSDTYNHDHGANTGNLLSNITLAYIDSIMCQKD